MSRRQARSNARRMVEAVVRVEGAPYDYGGTHRPPRLGGAVGILWCVPSAAIAGGTLPPSGSPGGPLAGQTIYTLSGTVYTALSGTFPVYCPYPSGVTASLLLAVVSNGQGGYNALAQSCR